MIAPHRLQTALNRLPGVVSRAAVDGPVRVGVVGLADAAVASLDRVLRRLSAHAPLSFVVDAGRGDVALVDAELAADLNDQEWSTLFGARPVIAVVEPGAPMRTLRTPYCVASAFDDGELLSTLNTIPEMRERRSGRPAHRPDAAATQAHPPFVAALLQCWTDKSAPCLQAAYDDGAAMLIDFARGEVHAHAAAWERLRARRELPRLISDADTPMQPSARVKIHRIETLLWAAGVASAELPLWGAPLAWRQANIAALDIQHVVLYSRAPAHLHLAELMSRGVTTAAALRRASHVDERELRVFLQAGLFLRLLQWVP